MPDRAQPIQPRLGRRLTLLTCCLSLFIAQLDATVVNVGLPTIQRGLGGGLGGLQWIVDAYVLVLGSLAISSGAAADRFGRRRVFRTGLATFAAGSAGCSAAPSIGVLLGFRAVQAVGASMLMPSTLAIIADVFRDPRERAAAVGTWAGVAGVAMVAGPLLGGVLVGTLGWRSLFWVNLPVCALALTMSLRLVPESRAARARALDPAGQLLLMASLSALTLAIIQAPSWGWPAPPTVALLIGGSVTLGGFVAFELRAREPMLDPRLFARPALATAAALAVLAYAAVMGFLFLNTLYLQGLRGLSPLQAGLTMLPVTAAMAITAPVAGRLTGRSGPRIPTVAGGLLIAAGLGILSTLTRDTTLALVLVGYALIGVGWGALNPPITTLAMSALARDRAGMAAAIAGSARQVGASLGVAVMGSLTAGSLATLGGRSLPGHGPRLGSAGGFQLGYLAGAGAAALIVLIAATARAGNSE